MTVFEALAAFQASGGRAELWRAPALQVFRYGSRQAAGSGGAALSEGSGAMTALRGLAVTGGLPGENAVRLRGGDGPGTAGAFSASRGLRQSVGAEERRLSEAVRLMREQGRQPEAEPGEIFSQLERRLLAEIGAG